MTATEQAYFFDACRRGNFENVEEFYHHYPEVINSEDLKGYTPLIIAVYNNQPTIVEFLLAKGAKTDAADQAGNTALMGACFKGYKEVAQQLVDAAVDVNQRNYQGANALTFAATFGQMEIARMLLEKGADMNAQDVRGKSPLDHAAIQENWPMVNLIQSFIQQHQ